ncbi:hypothetical protein PIB30_068047 [Stylosanthes scabra]|uniref:Uncharacterized protein n=1 Tax=Stylosanthes scabra TaxID=79078 RepID=A0ABU6XNQ3_9FABA|nr:hypothetical protein [Stylosanthes scabra]
MEEKNMEDKGCASFTNHNWSGIPSGRSSDGGSRNKRKKKFAAPTCHCGIYAILFQSSTTGNANGYFLGVQTLRYLTTTPHYRYFACLDEYADAFSVYEVVEITQDSDPMRKLEEKNGVT